MTAAGDDRAGSVLVTGAAGAIGGATVRCFVEAGLHVIALDRDRAVLDDAGPCVAAYHVDVADARGVADAIADACATRVLRHVVGVAGGALPSEPATRDDPASLSPEEFRASVDANLVTQYVVLHAALPWLRRATGADRSVTFTSSFNALAGWGMPAYSAAKAGLIGLMHALTASLGAEGIRVNVVAPGTVRTPRTERIWRDDVDHFPRLAATTALGRLGTPDDVARAYLALATTLTHVTGQVLVVDGGQSTKRP
ncbi:MAG TPA: SDR family oxidoreductase [Gemmatimonadaceae bacterium]|nr:SDR family oxidoreductase [Gemmatimonadaceae bacterium]